MNRREFLAAAIAAATVAVLPFKVEPTRVARAVPGALTLADLLKAREALRRMDMWPSPAFILVHPNAGVTDEMAAEWYRLTGTRVVYASVPK